MYKADVGRSVSREEGRKTRIFPFRTTDDTVKCTTCRKKMGGGEKGYCMIIHLAEGFTL